jgi:chemotaxis protein methyltransferase CheR
MSMTTEDYQFLQRLMRERAANVLELGKESTTEMRLGPVLRSEGLGSVTDLVKKLRASTFTSLHNQVVESLTVH